jgi:methionine-S-sulfoxide reductase
MAVSGTALTHSASLLSQMMNKVESIVLGGGCFWCLEAAYQQVNGVVRVESGYAGGDEPNPTYAEVSSGMTKYVEVVKISFNPDLIPLESILGIFWVIHDPTTLNRQGADTGPQYASVIYYGDEYQYNAAKQSLDEAAAQLNQPIVTRIESLPNFYIAEDYHQNYYKNNPGAGYCQVVIDPKLLKLKQHFSSLLAT